MQLKPNTVTSNRIIYTPSSFARTSLLHLQEAGTLQALLPHQSLRENLSSYLFFFILSGSGTLTYGGQQYKLSAGEAVFIDCHVPYSHSTDANLWSLTWAHFNGPTMYEVYEKYKARGGKTVFRSEEDYGSLLNKLIIAAKTDSFVRDMKINSILSELLVLLMKDSWNPDTVEVVGKRNQLAEIKEYIDANFASPISLAFLANKFYINKTYLSEIFKEQYGIGMNEYLIEKRITKVKEMLRFTNMTTEAISWEVGINGAAYLSRIFKKVEGISPAEYRKQWN